MHLPLQGRETRLRVGGVYSAIRTSSIVCKDFTQLTEGSALLCGIYSFSYSRFYFKKP